MTVLIVATIGAQTVAVERSRPPRSPHIPMPMPTPEARPRPRSTHANVDGTTSTAASEVTIATAYIDTPATSAPLM